MLGSVSASGSGRVRGPVPGSFSVAVSSIEITDLQSRYNLSLPLHSLVSDKNRTDNRRGVLTTHVWTNPGDADGFYRVTPDLYVCSPELAFLQVASTMSVQSLVKLGFELCGRYQIRESGVDYFREPLSTVGDLRRVANAHRSIPGVRNARRALKYVRDNSYSPRETAAAMLLGLPYKYGGASFGMPLMNCSVELHDAARNMIGQRICKCDLFYPSRKLDLEYDSYEFHSGPAKMEHDSLRRDALALEGIRVVTITNQQIADQNKLNILIQLISKLLGKRFRPQGDEFLLHQRQLIELVTS